MKNDFIHRKKNAKLFEPRTEFLNELVFSYINSQSSSSSKDDFWLGIQKEKSNIKASGAFRSLARKMVTNI